MFGVLSDLVRLRRKTAATCKRRSLRSRWLAASVLATLLAGVSVLVDIFFFVSVGGIRAESLQGAAADTVAIPPSALSFAVYATGTGCGAITLSGGAFVDSFDSSQGSYSQTKRQSDAAVGVSGNINLSGSSTIYGRLFALNTNVGTCTNGVPGITLSGNSQATQGYIRLSAAPLFPSLAPATPGTQDYNLTANLTLPPGNYRNIAVSGRATLTLSAGTYNINSLSLSGQSVLAVAAPGQVIVNVAGNGVSQPINFSGGTLRNASAIPSNFQLMYGGSQSITLSGGSMSYGVVYAPNAGARLSGRGDWFGAITVKTLDNSGGSAIHYDRSLIGPPTITHTVTPPPNPNGWHNTNVVVSFVCSSPLGITNCSSPVPVTTEGRSQVVTGTATDNAGNTATASVSLNVDKTAPMVTAAPSPAANANGWNNAPVMVAFTAADALSGVDQGSVTAPVILSANGTNLSATGQARDLAGNVGSVTRSGINIDQVPPTIAATLSPAANASGWNNTPVTAHFTCDDSGSGVATCSPDAVLSTEGANQTTSGTVTDLAGNSASITSNTVNIDVTPPVVALVSPPNGSVVAVPGVTLTGTVSDALSGVSSVGCNGQSATVTGGSFQCAVTLTQGPNPISTLAADVAGNTSAAPWALTFTPTTGPPVLTLSGIQPVSGTVIAQSPVTVRGTLNDPTARVTVQNVIASVIGTAFEARNIALSEGSNQILVHATTTAGAQANATLNLTLDSVAPALTVFSPPDRSLFTATSATVSATVSDATALTCSINGAPIAVQNGLFSSVVALASGSNAIAVSCLDAAGHASSRMLTLFQDNAPLVITAVEPADGATQVPTAAPVQVTFSEPVDAATATASTMILRAGDSILPVDVSLSPDGLVGTATPRAPWPQGTTIVITVTSGVQDQTGNPIAVPFVAAFTTEGTALPPGVVVGEVYDDSRSLPLPGATVEALDRATRQVLATTQSDDRGRYLLDPAQDDFLVRISKEGYTTVERTSVESRGSYAEALDARLTVTSALHVIQAALGGTLTTAAGDGVVLPAGAFATDASVSLTAISGQGPVGTLPPGWTPLGIVHLEGPQGLPFPATLRLVDRSQAASGRSGVIAHYESGSSSWVTLAQVVVPAVGSPIEHTGFIRPGQFALLVPDEGSGGPGPTTAGEPLPAGSAGEIPSNAQASGAVTPSVGRADDPTPAQARVDVVDSTALRSGTLLRGDFMEVITLRAGGVVSPFDTSQDFVAYRAVADASGTSLAASFPIAPSRTFAPAEVTDGSITVRLSRGVATGRTLVGPAGGGVSSGDGSRVIVPAGALSGNVPVSLRRLDATTFPLSVPVNVTFVGGLDLDLAGAVAALPLTLSLSGSGSTVPTGSTVVVAEVRNIKGFDRLVIVALGQVTGSEVTTMHQIGGVTLPGVRQSGRYGFYRLEGAIDPVRGTARTDTGRRDGHVAEIATLPFVSVTDAAGAFVLVSRPGSFDLTATAAANGDQARVSGTTGPPLPEIVIGPTPPRVDAVKVRLPPLEGDFAGPIALVGRPAPVIDDDSSGESLGNANGVLEAGERIELTLHVRNDGTIPIQGGFFALDVRGPPGSILVEPAGVPLTFLAPDDPLAVGPFVFTVPAGTDPALMRYRLAYANHGGLANVIPFSLPLGVEHPNVSPASEITILFSEPVIRTSLNGAVTLAREDASGPVPVDASLVVASDSASLMLRPLAPLTDDTVYRITLTSQIVDADGRSLADAPYVERLRTVDRTPPPVIPPGQIEASIPGEEGFVTITGSPGSVNPDDVVIGLNATTGFAALATVNADGSFSVLVAADVTDELTVLVRDASGNTTTIRVGTLVRRDPITGEIVLVIVGRAGGTVSAPDGIRLIVPEGAVHRGTELAVQRLTEPFQLPADLATDAGLVAAFNARFTVVDRIRITTNVARFVAPITLSLPAPSGAVAGQQYVVWRNLSVTFGGPLADLDRRTGITLADNPRGTAERLVIVESATVKDQGGQLVLSTDSPPFPGITEGGDFTFAKVNDPLVYLAGEVRRDSTTGPVVPGVVVRSLPDALVNSPFAAVTGSDGRFLVADGSLTGPLDSGTVVSSRLDVVDQQYSRVIRRDVRGVVGRPAPPGTLVAHLDEPFVLPTRLPPEITDILGDLEPPTVELLVDGPTYDEGFSLVGAPLRVTLSAEDNEEVVFVALELNQGSGFSPVSLSPDRTFELIPAQAALLTFRGQAHDRSGNVTFVDTWVRVLPPGGDITPLPPPPLSPSIYAVVPGAGQQGTQLPLVRVFGRHTDFTGGVSQVSLGGGIVVSLLPVANATELQVALAIAADAAPGPRTVTVVTVAHGLLVLPDGFTVMATPTPPQPRLRFVDPPTGERQQGLSVRVIAEHTDFTRGVSHLGMGSGIVVGQPTVTSATELHVPLTIDANAAFGPRTVTVDTTAHGVLTLHNGFTVTGGAHPAPHLLCGTFDGPIQLQFVSPVATNPISPQALQLIDPEGEPVPFDYRLDRNGSRIVIVPRRYLRIGSTYEVLTAGLLDTNGLAFATLMDTCAFRAPQPTLITRPAPAGPSASPAVLTNVTDVALIGDTLVALNHPDGAAPGDNGAVHALKVTFNELGGVTDVGAELLSSHSVFGRPLSLATHGTTAFVANQFLGSMTLGQPLFGTAVLPSGPLPTADLILGCTSTNLVTALFFGSDNVCQTLTQLWNYPSPASNLEIFNLSDPLDPQQVGRIALNALPPELWDPMTWPDRVEVIPRIDAATGTITGHRVAVQSFGGNLEFLTASAPPERLGIVGQIKFIGELDHRGPDALPGTTDDHTHEFYDAAFFPAPLVPQTQTDEFAVTLVRDGIRIMQTAPASARQSAVEIQFVPMGGTFGGRVGGVPNFEYGGDDGTQFKSHLAFLATTDNTLQIVDVTNPIAPALLGGLTGIFGPMSFDACRGLAYLLDRDGAVHVVDFNDPSRPLELNAPGGSVEPFRFFGLGARLTWNGNVNRDGVVYVASENGVGAFRIDISGILRYPKRKACRLTIVPSAPMVPITTSQTLVALGGKPPYMFVLAPPPPATGTRQNPHLTDNSNGTATFEAGSQLGKFLVQATDSSAAPSTALSHLTVVPPRVARIVAANSRVFPGHTVIPFSWNLFIPYREALKDIERMELRDDVNVSLRAVLDPSDVNPAALIEEWNIESVPAGINQSILNRVGLLEARLGPLTVGGAYKAVYRPVPEASPSEANIVLPLAGADVTEIVREDLRRADAFAARVIRELPPLAVLDPSNLQRWFNQAADYRGILRSRLWPSVDESLSVDESNHTNGLGYGGVITWFGVPTRTAKLNNFIVGYAMEKIGVPDPIQWLAQIVGTSNDESGNLSFFAGVDLARGRIQSYDLVEEVVRRMFNRSDGQNTKFWPNPGNCSPTPSQLSDCNYAPNDIFWSQGIFTSPRFLQTDFPLR